MRFLFFLLVTAMIATAESMPVVAKHILANPVRGSVFHSGVVPTFRSAVKQA